MIRNQWYGILWSKKLKAGKIVVVRRFGLNLILFRTEDGKAACVLDGCAHRKASLGGGCVRNGNIACPFHGIEYDASGKCVFVPSDGRSSTVSYSRFDLKHFPINNKEGQITGRTGRISTWTYNDIPLVTVNLIRSPTVSNF